MEAVDHIAAGDFGHMVFQKGCSIVFLRIKQATNKLMKLVAPEGQLVQTAEARGITLGC